MSAFALSGAAAFVGAGAFDAMPGAGTGTVAFRRSGAGLGVGAAGTRCAAGAGLGRVGVAGVAGTFRAVVRVDEVARGADFGAGFVPVLLLI